MLPYSFATAFLSCGRVQLAADTAAELEDELTGIVRSAGDETTRESTCSEAPPLSEVEF